MRVNLLVEGYVDEAVGRRLLDVCGHEAGATYGKKGWTYIQQKVQAFDKSCAAQGLLTLVDSMDTGLDCAPSIIRAWIPRRSHKHIFRLVTREIESWILADREAIASFLGVSLAKIPHHPELLPDPKQALINLARGSRRKAIRDALVPVQGYSASEGPLYSSEMGKFVAETWRPEEATANAASLEKCIARLRELRG